MPRFITGSPARQALLVFALLATLTLAGCQPLTGVPTPTATPVWLPTRPAQPSTSTGVQFSTPMPTPTRPQPTPTPAFSPTPTPKPAPTTPPPPALSGRLVFQTVSGGDIYVVNADGSGLRRLTQGNDPAWSPDGNWIAFTRWTHPQGVYLIRPDGSDEHPVAIVPETRSPTWAADGRRLAFAQRTKDSSSTPSKPGYPALPGQENWKVRVVNLDDGKLTDWPGDRFSYAPAWDPTGERIAHHGQDGLYVTEIKGTPRLITPGYAGINSTSPAWSPDGSRIAFMRRQHDHWEIFLIAPDGSGMVSITPPPVRSARPINSVSPAWSPDGHWLAFVSDRDGEWKLWAIRPDGSGLRLLLDMPLTYQGINERVVSWGR